MKSKKCGCEGEFKSKGERVKSGIEIKYETKVKGEGTSRRK
jgi:hypothetical protein